LEGSPQCSAEKLGSEPSENIAAAERERCNSLLRLNEEYTPGLVGTTPFPRIGYVKYDLHERDR